MNPIEIVGVRVYEVLRTSKVYYLNNNVELSLLGRVDFRFDL
jgi:hypothetical protein